MSKVKEFSMALDEIIEAGDKLHASFKDAAEATEIIVIALRALNNLFKGSETQASQTDSKQRIPLTSVPEKAEVSPDPLPEIKTYTKEEVRAVLAAKSSSGKRAEVKAILTKYGASQLGQLAPEHYAAVVAEAEALNG